MLNKCFAVSRRALREFTRGTKVEETTQGTEVTVVTDGAEIGTSMDLFLLCRLLDKP